MRTRKHKAPSIIAQCEVGDIVRTPCGTLIVTADLAGAMWARLYDVARSREMSDIFQPRQDLSVTELCAEGSRYATAIGAGDQETDPLRGGE